MPSPLLSRDERDRIVAAIVKAESNTSAEIRVHVESRCRGDVLDRAADVFRMLKMDRTAGRNGVLVYLALKDRKDAIIGDENVNLRVRRDFWRDCHGAMAAHFAEGEFAGGICAAVNMLEEELKESFPHEENDVNELPDEISFGE